VGSELSDNTAIFLKRPDAPDKAKAPTPRPINPPAEPAKRDRPFLVPEEAPESLFAFVFGGRDGILLLSA